MNHSTTGRKVRKQTDPIAVLIASAANVISSYRKVNGHRPEIDELLKQCASSLRKQHPYYTRAIVRVVLVAVMVGGVDYALQLVNGAPNRLNKIASIDLAVWRVLVDSRVKNRIDAKTFKVVREVVTTGTVEYSKGQLTLFDVCRRIERAVAQHVPLPVNERFVADTKGNFYVVGYREASVPDW